MPQLLHLIKELREIKGVISRQAGLEVKTDTFVTISYTRVSALTPDETMRSDNSFNSFKCKSRGRML